MENTRELTITVSFEDTAEAVKSGGLPVLATPRVAALFERCAFELLQDRLLSDKSSVGTELYIEHISPTPVGMSVSLSATLVELDAKKAVFQLNAKDSKGEIARGTHTRFIIDTERFLNKALLKADK